MAGLTQSGDGANGTNGISSFHTINTVAWLEFSLPICYR